MGNKNQIKKEYFILNEDGKISNINSDTSTITNKDFRILVDKEALGKSGMTGRDAPIYIKHMKKFGIEWEPMSDSGHMRYGPEGALMMGLISDYANKVVREVGFPIYNVLGTNMFNLAEKPVKQHAELFGDRLYQLEVDDKKIVLRYAACHQQFAMIKDWSISYKNLPFGAFEIADSYRLEQSGELLLGFRLRKMNMPDMHVFTADMEEAKKALIQVHKKIYDIMRSQGKEYVSLYNTTSMEFIQKEGQFLKELLDIEQKPALLSVYPPGKDYYWVLNIEYHIIDQMERPREIGTVQLDFGNAERFGIKYITNDGTEKRPIILHTALIGTIERFMYSLFDIALSKGEDKAVLPIWVSPIQVRICPITERNLATANKIANILEAINVRVEIDDRNKTLQHKILDAEKHWVPIIIPVSTLK